MQKAGFYDVPNDFLETDPLDLETLSDAQRDVRGRLQQAIQENTREGFYGSPEND